MSDDPFEDEPQQNQADDLRVKLEQANKEKAKLARERDELAAFKAAAEAERRQSTAAMMFTEVGLDPKLSGLFLKDRPDVQEIDADTVRGWAGDYNLAAKPAEPVEQVAETPQPQVEAPQPFQPQVQGGGQVNAEITWREYQEAVTSGDRDRHDWAVGLSQKGLVRR